MLCSATTGHSVPAVTRPALPRPALLHLAAPASQCRNLPVTAMPNRAGLEKP